MFHNAFKFEQQRFLVSDYSLIYIFNENLFFHICLSVKSLLDLNKDFSLKNSSIFKNSAQVRKLNWG